MSDVIYWSELAELNHATQVERFGWCGCEDEGTLVYMDCPSPVIMCGDCIRPIRECGCLDER